MQGTRRSGDLWDRRGGSLMGGEDLDLGDDFLRFGDGSWAVRGTRRDAFDR